MKLSRRFLFAASAALAMAGCATQPQPMSVADAIAANPSLSTLNGLVHKAGLTDTLKGTGPFTVFAPTDEAFKAVPAKTLDELSRDPAKLKGVLTYHVLPARLDAAHVKNDSVTTINGAKLALSKAGEFVTVEEAMVQTADIQASNGLIHTVDRVLLPPAKK